MVRQGATWLGKAGLAGHGGMRLGLAWRGAVRQARSGQGKSSFGLARQARRGTSGFGSVRQGEVWLGRRGSARSGAFGLGLAGCVPVRHGMENNNKNKGEKIMAIKHISGTGNLGQDPQLRYTKNGTAVCEYSLGATAARQNQNGQWEENGAPLWLSLTFWGGRSRTLFPRRQTRATNRIPRNRANPRPLEYPRWARRNHLPGTKPGNTNQTPQEPTCSTRRQRARAGAMGRAHR